ncbi:MAG: hypothetical protein EOL98_05155 [Negativicutes bacterium]|nr:hypothetical protein [Negativicutes bacterium]
MKSTKLLMLLAGIVFSFMVTFSSVVAAEQVKFKEGKCSFSLPVYEAYEKFEASWDGPCLNGLAECEGLIKYTIEYEDKTKYEAEGKMTMKKGLAEGRAVLNFSNGDKYDIIFAAGQPQNGTVIRSDGRKYEGEFYHNYAHGKGVFTKADGTSYDGYFQMDKQHGYGIERDKNGKIIYQGEWLNGFHADDPAANRTLEGFLSMPWETERKAVEETLNKRPGTEYVDMLFLGKYYGFGAKLPSPQNGRYYKVTGKFNNETAELTAWFYEEKFAGGRASFFNSEQEIMSKFEETKKNLIAKYGKPNSETGKGTAAFARWLFIDNNYIDLYIRKLGYETNNALPADKKKPFNLTLDYLNYDLMNKINPTAGQTSSTSDF